MALLEILKMGNPLLRNRARELTPQEIGSQEILDLTQNMLETMLHAGGIGIAAPQVGHSLRLALIDLKSSDPAFAHDYGAPLEMFINPRWEVLDPTPQCFWEGCLSVPGLRGEVARPRQISLRYTDSQYKEQELIAEGFMACVFQHEFDHLDGILYVDRLTETRKLAFVEEFSKHWSGEAHSAQV